MVINLQTLNIKISESNIFSLSLFLQIPSIETFIFDGNWFVRILLNAIIARSAICRLASTAETSNEIITILSEGDH